MRKVLIIVFFTALSCSLSAQLENIPLITVIGESVVKVMPDYVVIGLKIKKDITENINGQVRAVFEIFNKEETKVKLFDFDPNNISEGITQYDNSKYSKELFVYIKDLSKLDRYLLDLNNLGFKEFSFIDYRVSKLKEYKEQARKEAMNSALKKASALAGELGQLIGKAHTIEELRAQNYNWYNLDNSDNYENVTFKLGADNYLIEPGYIMLTSSIKVSFDLKK